eukprot:scaffold337546_cov35-Attheya_sp.AAC.1
MFRGASAFNDNIGDWDVSSGRSFNLSDWAVSSTSNRNDMFTDSAMPCVDSLRLYPPQCSCLNSGQICN